MIFRTVVFSLLLCLQANAEDKFLLKYHVNAVDGVSSVKGLSLAKQSSWYMLETKTELGGWFDTRPGAKSGAFGFYGVGVQPEAGAFYVNFFQSVGLISSPDAYLGGHFQFCEEVGLGIKDQDKGSMVGLFYKHISSAGIYKPNKGRDMIGIQVGLSW